MGYETHFYGKLEFARKLTTEELTRLDGIIDGGDDPEARRHLFQMIMFGGNGDEISRALIQQAEAERAIERDGKGPLVLDPHSGADLTASMRHLITGEGLSPKYACHLRISDDKTGLVYRAEKTYDVIGGVNFIIANAREKIPGFGLKGSLFASTEFEPYTWLVKINEEGWAYQEKCEMYALWDHDKKAYLEHLQVQLYCRRQEVKRGEDPRRTYRIMADNICDRIDQAIEHYGCELRWARHRLRNGIHNLKARMGCLFI